MDVKKIPYGCILLIDEYGNQVLMRDYRSGTPIQALRDKNIITRLKVVLGWNVNIDESLDGAFDEWT